MDKTSRLSNRPGLGKAARSGLSAEGPTVSREEQTAPESQPPGAAHGEGALIHSARQGDLEAFNRLVLAHQDKMYQQAYYLLGDVMAAEDAVQEAFLAAYRALPGYRGGSLRSWLSRIVTNKCLDELRRRKSQPTTSFQAYDGYGEEIESPYWAADPEETPEERLLSDEFVHLIEGYLERLSSEQRTILVLVDVLGMAYKEAAQATGWRPGTVKSRLARARVQMRNFLRGYLELKIED
jgi:RNA polymerase sigma-70 factor (ECF subfamily)